MPTFIIILIVIAVITTVVFLVRGIIAFLQTTEADLKSDGTGPSASGINQNRMMRGRILAQAAAVVLLVFLILLSRG